MEEEKKLIYVLTKVEEKSNLLEKITILGASYSKSSLHEEMLTEAECYYETFDVLEYNDEKVIFNDINQNWKITLMICETPLINW